MLYILLYKKKRYFFFPRNVLLICSAFLQAEVFCTLIQEAQKSKCHKTEDIHSVFLRRQGH